MFLKCSVGSVMSWNWDRAIGNVPQDETDNWRLFKHEFCSIKFSLSPVVPNIFHAARCFILSLTVAYSVSLLCVYVPKRRIIGWKIKMNEKGFWMNLPEVTEKTQETSVSTAGVLASIWVRYLQNKILKLYRYVNLLGPRLSRRWSWILPAYGIWRRKVLVHKN
jgi:hypothetical protein